MEIPGQQEPRPRSDRGLPQLVAVGGLRAEAPRQAFREHGQAPGWSIVVDAEALRASWQAVRRHGEAVPLYFYSHLALCRPDIRDMFPVEMACQRDRFVAALGHILSNVDKAEVLDPYLGELGCQHARLGVMAEHFEPVEVSLLETLAYFLDEGWHPGLAAEWRAAYRTVADAMRMKGQE